MSFTYDLANNPTVAYIRLLIADTDEANQIFSDEEIMGAYAITASVFQSGAFYSGVPGTGRTTLPSSPVSYFRVAAVLLDALAANKSRLAGITKLLDVELSPAQAATALAKKAQEYRTVDDESGAFVVIEQCTTDWSFRDRFLKTVQRETV